MESFDSLPRMTIISEKEFHKSVNLQNANVIRLSRFLKVEENNEIDRKRLFKNYSMLSEKSGEISSKQMRDFMDSIKNIKPTVVYSLNEYLIQLFKMEKINQLQAFLDQVNFPYKIQMNHIDRSINYIKQRRCPFSKEENKSEKDLNFENKFYLIILSWIFSLNTNWANSDNKVIVLDKWDCFNRKDDFISFIHKYYNAFFNVFSIDIKVICISHRINVSCPFYKINSKEELNLLNNLIDFGQECAHGYVDSFNGLKLEEFDNQFNHLKNLDEWENIPMFSIIIGANGIGKTTFLTYFHKIYENSALLCNFLENETNEAFEEYIAHLKKEFYEGGKNKNLRALIEQNPLPVICKCSPKYHLPILYALSENNKLATSINKHLEERKFKWQIQICEKIQANFSEFVKSRLKTNETAVSMQMELKMEQIFLKSTKSYKIGNLKILSINEFTFVHNETKIKYKQLSSGEKLQLSIYLWEYDILMKYSKINKEKHMLLLIDEPDSHLHPSKLNEIISLLKKDFVKEMKMQVIMTTHNPSIISLVDKENVFVMFEENDKIKIANSSNNPILLTQLLSTGVWDKYIQQTVIVETTTDQLFYTEINRQLHQISIQNGFKFELFPTSLRFQLLSRNNSNNSQSVERNNYLNDIIEDLGKFLKSKIEKNFSELRQEYESIDEDILKYIQKKKLVSEKSINRLCINLDNLKDFPNDFLELKKIETFDNWTKNMIEKLHKFYEDEYNAISNNCQTFVKSYVDQSNYTFDFDMKLRNNTFGIINIFKNGIPANQEDLIKKDYIICTDRYDLNNYIFDPLNLFFVLRKENFDSKRAKEIMGKLSAFDDNHINLDNWNSYITNKDAISDQENDFKKALKECLNQILEVVQTALIDILNEEEEEKYLMDDVKKRDFEFIQPNIKLSYHEYILDEEICLKTISKLFCDCNKSICEEGCKTKFFKESNNDKEEISPNKFLSYLIENQYNFLISRGFFDQFKSLTQSLYEETNNLPSILTNK